MSLKEIDSSDELRSSCLIYYKTRLVDSHGVVVYEKKQKSKQQEYHNLEAQEFVWSEDHQLHCATYVFIQVRLCGR